MIENIVIKNEASFDEEGEILNGLERINFLYGANGSGKTTISKIICDENAFPDCVVNWEGGKKVQSLVYNRAFVEGNFQSDKELKGIFTLGAHDVGIIKSIEEGKKSLDDINDKIKGMRLTLEGDDGNGGKIKEINKLEGKFADLCWTFKLKYDSDFMRAFSGARDKKEKFKARLLEKTKNNSSDHLSLDDLIKKANTIFNETLSKEVLITPLNFIDLVDLEEVPILSKKVIGKEDVDIASMVKKLGNSDWVKEGLGYFDNNNEFCPFCQQKTDAQFSKSLSEYFNEEYIKDIDSIESVKTNYEAYSNSALEGLELIIKEEPKYLDFKKLKSQKDLIAAKISANKQHIERKIKEASVVVKLESLKDVFKEIQVDIDLANKKAMEHNSTLDNLEKEENILKDQIWRFIYEENKTEIEDYVKKKKDLSAAVKALESNLLKEGEAGKNKNEEIQKLEKKITSIQPTISEINSLLSSFGFTGFSLAKSDKDGFYKLIRPGGEDVKETLSEGEKTFITFLYFYHLLKGSSSSSGMTADRVVVFDDPVSSLDSDILFIVSNLIKNVFKELRSNVGYIKQVFVLTHNIYFHKEVCFNKKRSGGASLKDETFWMLKKINNISALESYDKNPIKTSYELLWDEVRCLNKNSQTIQNVMRRILENYFNIMGNMDNDEIINKFEGKEKQICSSLFSWVNDGSHFANDDLYLCCDDSTVDLYLGVFKKAFEKAGHIEHYRMMMGINNEEVEEVGEE